MQQLQERRFSASKSLFTTGHHLHLEGRTRGYNQSLDSYKRSFNLVLGGDGRADSPGHSAKYGSYSVIDLKQSKVVDIKLVQV